MILVDAIYIHESGGKSLLEYLILSLNKSGTDFFLLADERIDSTVVNEMTTENCTRVSASESTRKKFYKALDTRITKVFCFANVPPPVIIKNVNVSVFFQNTLILAPIGENNFYTFRQKMLFLLKRIYIRYVNRREYEWIVQTVSVKNRLANALKTRKDHIRVIPFYNTVVPQGIDAQYLKKDIFLYVADGVPHKNHLLVFDTWLYLFVNHRLQPELHVTIPEKFEELILRISLLVKRGVKIINHGVLEKETLAILYSDAAFFICPSVAESFGLPLIEATMAGCKIIAADLPYVNDVIVPTAVFDPYSVEDMAKTVVKCMHNEFTNKSKLKVKNEIEELIKYINHN